MSKPLSHLPLAAATLAVRLVLIVAGCLAAGISVQQLALLHDGWEYLRLSQALALAEPGSIAPENLRLFPGYPVAIALVSVGQQPEISALAVSLAAAVACGPLLCLLGGDRRLGWWLVAFTPPWLLYTSLAMSESLATALTLAALLAIMRQRMLGAAVLISLAFGVRPVSALLFLPLAIEAARQRRWRTLAGAGLILAAAAGALLLFNRVIWGNPMTNVDDYAAATQFQTPLLGLIADFLSPQRGIGRKAITLAAIALTLAGAWGLWRMARQGNTSALPLLAWHLPAALFYLSYPADWLFGSLDRYLAGLWPTSLIGLTCWLPRSSRAQVLLITALGVVSWGLALRWIVNMAAVFPFAERALPLWP